MRTRQLAALLALGAAVTTAFVAPRLVADVSGKWAGSVDGPQGAMPLNMNLTQKGDSLGGSLESPAGSTPLIGVVKADSVFFSFNFDAGGQVVPINGTAIVKSDTAMAGSLEVTGMAAFPFTATRQKQ
ncbi:MAG: hypothetical protein KJT01_15540 [Gemmatimonadetes bacterium]|nr:hypothetical protein [Gemmatimonadota bacterium]